MRKFTLRCLTLFILFFSMFLFAQQKPTKLNYEKKSLNKSLDKLKLDLSLTSDQMKLSESIHDKYKSEMKKLKEQIKPLKTKLNDLEKLEKIEFEKILTIEQKKKLRLL